MAALPLFHGNGDTQIAPRKAVTSVALHGAADAVAEIVGGWARAGADPHNYVPVMGLIHRVLDERPSHTAPAARFRNELEDYMAEDQADQTLKTIVSWGRYAELFAYDEQSELFSLENPH